MTLLYYGLFIYLLGKRTKFRKCTKYRKWGERPQSGPSMCNVAEGRKVAHHCVEKPISGI